MADKVADWVSEKCSTVGAGVLVLTGAVDSSQAKFRDKLTSGLVFYSILDGLNRETGEGVFNGAASITRNTVHATLVNGTYSGTNPAPISLSGSGVVSCTYNAIAYNAMAAEVAALQVQQDINTVNILANTNNISANDTDIATNAVNIATNVTDIATNAASIGTVAADLATLDGDVGYRETAITALESGGALSQNGATAVLVAVGQGEIIDSYSDTENQLTEEVDWLESTFDLLANAGMPELTGSGVTEIGVSSGGVIGAYPNGLSSVQRRTVIKLGVVEYFDRVITSVATWPVVSNQIGNTLMDLIDYVDAASRMKGLTVRPTEIGNLTFWRDIGTLFSPGVNYENNKADMNVKAVAAAGAVNVAVEFHPVIYNNGNSTGGAAISLVPSTVYEPDGQGTVSPLTNNYATIHYVLQSIAGTFYLAYGQQQYLDYATAKSNLFADKSAHLFAAEFTGMILLAQIVVADAAAGWSDTTAEIFPTGAASSSGAGGGTATSALNISYSDTYALGTNVQVALDSLGALKLSANQHSAVNAAAAPSATNAYATIADVDAVTGVTDHALLTNIGTTPHDQIDAHIVNTANPHSVSAATVGLGNVDNTSDASKPISSLTQAELNGKALIDKNVRGTLVGGILYLTTDGAAPGP